MRRGQHGNFFWFESAAGDLATLLDATPDLVSGRCVAIASFDSGPITLSSEEVEQGWHSSEGISYIPQVKEVRELPIGEYDEWYILARCRTVGPLDTFVNYCGFGLSDPELRGSEQDPTWNEAERERQSLFWTQVERVDPEAVILNGDLLVVVLRDRLLAQHVGQWLAPTGPN